MLTVLEPLTRLDMGLMKSSWPCPNGFKAGCSRLIRTLEQSPKFEVEP